MKLNIRRKLLILTGALSGRKMKSPKIRMTRNWSGTLLISLP